MDRLNIVKSIIDISARQAARTFRINYNLGVFEDLASSEILYDLNKAISKNDVFIKRSFKNIFDLNVYRNFVYYLIRITKPAEVVETGVFHGLTTLWILQALEDNKHGRLTSIDLPRREWKKFFPNRVMGAGHQGEEDLPDDCEPGWIIPNRLKKRWDLRIGPSEQLLQPLLNKRKIDFFIHDSDHSYTTMKFEIQSIFKKFKNCLLVVDNFDYSKYVYELLTKGQVSISILNELDEFNDVFPRFAILKFGIVESSESRWRSQLVERKKKKAKI